MLCCGMILLVSNRLQPINHVFLCICMATARLLTRSKPLSSRPNAQKGIWALLPTSSFNAAVRVILGLPEHEHELGEDHAKDHDELHDGVACL